MKLSEKALKKIQDEMEHGEYQIPCGYENVEGMSIYHLEEHEFEPDDFQGAVVLTVEEAKALNNLILKLFYNEENRMSVFDATEFLTKRIRQAENK